MIMDTTQHMPSRNVWGPRVAGREGDRPARGIAGGEGEARSKKLLNSGQNRQDPRSCPDIFNLICQKHTHIYNKPVIRREKKYTRCQKRYHITKYMTYVNMVRHVSCLTDLYRVIYVNLFILTRRL